MLVSSGATDASKSLRNQPFQGVNQRFARAALYVSLAKTRDCGTAASHFVVSPGMEGSTAAGITAALHATMSDRHARSGITPALKSSSVYTGQRVANIDEGWTRIPQH